MRGAAFQVGHTLAELLVSISIFSGLMAVAVPEFSQLVKSVRLRGGMDAIASGLRLARFEAVKRNGSVVMCKSADGVSCNARGDWSQGWIVFHDTNNNGLPEPAESILYRELPLGGDLRLTGNSHIKDYVSYSAFGKAKTLSGAFQAGTFTVCRRAASKTDAYLVAINILGRPRVEKTVVEQCN